MRGKANVTNWCHEYINQYVNDSSIAIDLTVGNGYDTLELCRRARYVYGFDIQEIAILETKKKLENENLLGDYYLIHDNHSNILKYISTKVNFIVMNLGYLPRGDKSIITKWESTKKALEDGLSLLEKNGFFLITLYKSHKGAEEEIKGLYKFIKILDQKIYNVTKISFPNQENLPPELYIIERIIE